MAGEIVKVDGKDGLWVVVDMKNYEDIGSCSYSRDYYIIPYDPTLDNLEVDLSTAEIYKERGIHESIHECSDKMPYTKYGESNIRGVTKIFLERSFEPIKMPTR